jgi:hypothetical protein
MTELFDIPETKSPRLIWLEKHQIVTLRGKPDSWAAWVKGKNIRPNCSYGYGETEDDAITSLAIKLGLRLWNEE